MSLPTTLVGLYAVSFGYSLKSRPVIDNVSLSISPGEFIVLRGSNGCGKTTIIKGILGLLPVLSGTVVWNIDRTVVGYVPQETVISSTLPYTALDIVRCGVSMSSNTTKNAARDALAVVGLEMMVPSRYSDLSGGQKRRVLLARALVRKSPLLILDEPTANVDLPTEKIIEAVIGDLIAENNIAVIAITHAAGFGKKARELRIENGRIHE